MYSKKGVNQSIYTNYLYTLHMHVHHYNSVYICLL